MVMRCCWWWCLFCSWIWFYWSWWWCFCFAVDNDYIDENDGDVCFAVDDDYINADDDDFCVGHLWVACIMDHTYQLCLPKILQRKSLLAIIDLFVINMLIKIYWKITRNVLVLILLITQLKPFQTQSVWTSGQWMQQMWVPLLWTSS